MKIICIGRNYAEHAKELNNAIPTEPVYFMKPDTALLKDGEPFYFPDFTKDLHHEIEIVLKINKVGKHIAEEFAHKAALNYGGLVDVRWSSKVVALRAQHPSSSVHQRRWQGSRYPLWPSAPHRERGHCRR